MIVFKIICFRAKTAFYYLISLCILVNVMLILCFRFLMRSVLFSYFDKVSFWLLNNFKCCLSFFVLLFDLCKLLIYFWPTWFVYRITILLIVDILARVTNQSCMVIECDWSMTLMFDGCHCATRTGTKNGYTLYVYFREVTLISVWMIKL